MTRFLFLMLFLAGCSLNEDKRESLETSSERDTARVADTLLKKDTIAALEPETVRVSINDTLNSTARLIAGTADSNSVYKAVVENPHYINFSKSFSKRWNEFDSLRISKLTEFRNKELTKVVTPEKILFYPFSGPDILYADLFFPEAEKFILFGLEPVGTLPDFTRFEKDSLKRYYDKLNSSLHAILKFSFFRTESMKKDLKNAEVDGAIHLLFLFLSRRGNAIVSAKPITVDSLGRKVYLASFEALRSAKLKTKGVEIVFKTPGDTVKELNYYSLNAADAGLNLNPGFRIYLDSIKHFNAYLKGASYLLHKPHFSVIRDVILNGATTVVQDDSGIALRYFDKSDAIWDYTLFGNYVRPISLFRNLYQKDLDSLYKELGSVPLNFGIGYNFKDQNSNLMVAKRR